MPLRLGTRRSALAMWQAEHVRALLAAHGHEIVLVPIVTTGDKLQRGPSADRLWSAEGAAAGGKGLFVKEIEEALVRGEIDLAVHSGKDLPEAIAEETVLAAILTREDPRDAVITRNGAAIGAQAPGARLGTNSLRRAAQIRSRHPSLCVVPLRGNVDTRIARLRAGDFDVLVLALAGLRRLGRESEITEVLALDTTLPAPCQGAITVQARGDDAKTRAALGTLDHAPTRRAILAERALVAALHGGCNVPLAALAIVTDDAIALDAVVFSARDARSITTHVEGEEPGEVGRIAAQNLIDRGARTLLAEPR